MATVARRPAIVSGNRFTGAGGYLLSDVSLQNKSAETFKRGDLVSFDATPELILQANLVGGANDLINITTVIATLLARTHGIAMKDAPATGQIVIPVAVFQWGTVVTANLIEGTVGDSGGAHVAVATDVLAAVSWIFDPTNNRWYFSTTTTDPSGIVLAFPGIVGNDNSGGGVGDTDALVQVLLHSNQSQSTFFAV